MEKFGELIRKHREKKGLPLRKVAAELDVDTSILSKIERSERFATSELIPILSEQLEIDFKKLQILYLTEKIQAEYNNEPYLIDSLKQIIKSK
jgi:transcriptional regulator with XRE-family HTH domain